MCVQEYIIKYNDLLVRSGLRKYSHYALTRFHFRLRVDIRRNVIPHIMEDVQQDFHLALRLKSMKASTKKKSHC